MKIKESISAVLQKTRNKETESASQDDLYWSSYTKFTNESTQAGARRKLSMIKEDAHGTNTENMSVRLIVAEIEMVEI